MSVQSSPSLAERLRRASPEALLCALTIDPIAYSRNRHFSVFVAPAAHRAHRRASMLRRLGGELGTRLSRGCPVDVREAGAGAIEVSYEDGDLELRRTILLPMLEAVLLRILLAKRRVSVPSALIVRPEDHVRVQRAMGDLARSRIGKS